MKQNFLPFLLITISLFFCNNKAKPQASNYETVRINNMINQIRFIDYNDVFDNLGRDNNSFSSLEEHKYLKMLRSMLLIDTTHIQLVQKERPNLVEKFRSIYNFLDYSEIENNSRRHKMKFIETDIKSLKDCLKSEDVLKKILTNNYGQDPFHRVRIDDEVYIKDDKVAISRLYGSSEDLIKVWKVENGLYIERIMTIMSQPIIFKNPKSKTTKPQIIYDPPTS